MEDDAPPARLNSTVNAGTNEGANEELCAWPMRPLWTDDESISPDKCVFDQASYDSWMYEFPAFKVAVY